MIYEGKNPETDRPIIKVFLNPLINWIWIGVGIVVLGTLVAFAAAADAIGGARAGGGGCAGGGSCGAG